MDNKIFISGDVAAIEVYHKNAERYFYVLVDKAELGFIKKNVKSIWVFIYDHTNYSYCKTHENKVIGFHRFIMDTPKGLVVDHINHNGLDNRKENLRNTTYLLNSKNVLKGNRYGNPMFKYRKKRIL